MNTDNDVNLSGLVSKLGLNRRQFLAATTGMAAAAAVTAPSALAAPGANGVLVPSGKRGIILYTVRDAIGRDPLTSDLASGFKEVLATLATIGYKQIEFAGYGQHANARVATTSTTSRAPHCCALARRERARGRGQPRQHPEHDHGRDDRAVRHRLRDRQHPRDGAHRHRQRPHRQRLRRRLGARGRALELLRCPGGLARAEAVHPQPRHRLQLPARQRPARRPGSPDPQLRHPPPRALPGEHRPGVGLPRDGHLLGTRRPVPPPPYTAPDGTRCRTSSTRPRPSRPRPRGSPCSTPRTAPRRHRGRRLRHDAVRSGRHRLHDVLSSVGAKGYHNPMWEQDTAPGGATNPGQSLAFAKVSYDNMAALRG